MRRLTVAAQPSERRIVLLVAAVQFVNILDFVMVMPLGPDLAEGLNISTAHMGYLGGSYTMAAAISGIACSFFLDRFDRRKALALTILGLVGATALGGLATGLSSLLFARVLAGMFGGPATSLAFAIVTDTVPPERRGAALGTVMTAFSLASVLGVPAALEVSRLFGWQAPFFGLAGLGLVLAGFAIAWLPPLRAHLNPSVAEDDSPFWTEAGVLSLLTIALVMMGVFAVVPSIAPYVQYNLGYSRSYLGTLYLVGGVFSYIAIRLTGVMVDRIGTSLLVVIGTALHLIALSLAFFLPELGAPIVLFFILYMMSGSVRMVPLQTLATRVPSPGRRARYMSTQSAVQHISASVGAVGASFLLVAEADGSLLGMERVASLAFGVAILVPFLAIRVERLLRAR